MQRSKKAVLLMALIVGLMVAAACQTATPTSPLTPTPTATATVGLATPSPTQTQVATPTPTATSVASQATPTTTPESQAVTSSIANFTLESLAIQKGTTVEWTNQDAVPHTLAAGQPGALTGVWASETLPAGGTFSFPFHEVGTYQYFCAIHPSMRATIVVVEAGEEAPPLPTPDASGGDGYYY